MLVGCAADFPRDRLSLRRNLVEVLKSRKSQLPGLAQQGGCDQAVTSRDHTAEQTFQAPTV